MMSMVKRAQSALRCGAAVLGRGVREDLRGPRLRHQHQLVAGVQYACRLWLEHSLSLWTVHANVLDGSSVR